MDEGQRRFAEHFKQPLAAAIRDHALAFDATPTDRLAAAALLLAAEVNQYTTVMTSPPFVVRPADE